VEKEAFHHVAVRNKGLSARWWAPCWNTATMGIWLENRMVVSDVLGTK